MKETDKKKYLNTLKKIEKSFLEDEEALSAIDLLKRRIDFIEIEAADLVSNFQVPVEVNKEHEYALFSDGGCRGNPGPGSWGALAQNNKGEILFEVASFDQETTNNKMELTGALQAIRNIKEIVPNFEAITLYLYTDSNYVVQGLNTWRYNWKKRGWKKADKTPVSNLELWKALDIEADSVFSFKAIWVKGHNGHPQNERCDELCNEILDREM